MLISKSGPNITMMSFTVTLSLVYFVTQCASMSKMEFTTLGKSDLSVSKVCLGTMTWGQQNTVDEGIAQLDLAFSKYGINFIDTAEMYPIPAKPETQGATDKIIGKWLKSQDRSKVILATKVAGASDRLNWLPGRNGQLPRVRRSDILASVDESLKRLGTDYIDLLQIHWPDRYVPLFGAPPYDLALERDSIPFEDQLRAFEELIKAGKVRHIGVSNETPYGIMKFTEAAERLGLPRIVSVQNSYSLVTRSDTENGLTEVLSPRNEDVSLLVYSPLAGGILTGKYRSSDCPKSARLNLFQGYMERYKQSLCTEAVDKYCELADSLSMTPTELSLAWCYSRSHVTSTIIGATSLSQLAENIEAFHKRHLITADVVKSIDDIYKRYRDPSKT